MPVDGNHDQLHQELTWCKLRCQLLEVDKKVEELRSNEFRKIILKQLAQTASKQGSVELSAHTSLLNLDRLAGAAVESALDPPPPEMGKKKRSSRKLANSGPTPRRVHISSVPQSNRRSPQLQVARNRVPAGITRRTTSPLSSARDVGNGNVLRTRASSQAFLCEAGLMPFVFTFYEAARIQETPVIKCTTFHEVFGGRKGVERPRCDKVKGYEHVLCLNRVKQPYLPTTPGEPGLLLSSAPSFKYLGIYTRIPLPRTQLTVEEWRTLSADCRYIWSKIICGTARGDIRRVRVRIKLRKKLGREPSSGEVDSLLRNDGEANLQYADVTAAFNRGEERMQMAGIRCVGYDSGFATIIQRRA
ncbi:hypothetical protein BC834DRAFT_36636 [Gloeopeniophorella convolvens]|nr:hypothetical protein BC834DRAFT_36636 [Gloeopeniophorella convolvens]